VTAVEDGKAVLEFLEEHTLDLILMDIQMPVLDGLQAAEAIWQNELASKKYIPRNCDHRTSHVRGSRAVQGRRNGWTSAEAPSRRQFLRWD